MKKFRSADGTEWKVDVNLPGSSNAMIVFRHPDGATSRKDRYNWVLSTGPEARSVTGRLSPEKVLGAIGDAALATLFRRSMAVTRTHPVAPPRAGTAATRG